MIAEAESNVIISMQSSIITNLLDGSIVETSLKLKAANDDRMTQPSLGFTVLHKGFICMGYMRS